MLKNYIQFLRQGAQRGIASEKPFCEEVMSFDGKKITIKKNASYQAPSADNAVAWRGSNCFSVVFSQTSRGLIPVVYYPGWKATLTRTTTEGKKITIPARVYESDGLFLTVDAPDSEVWTAEFRFRPQSVYFGAIISFWGWLTFFYVLLFRKRA